MLQISRCRDQNSSILLGIKNELQSISPEAWQSLLKLIQFRTPKQHSSFYTELFIHVSYQMFSVGGSRCWQGSILRQNERQRHHSEWDVAQATTQFSLRDSAAFEGSLSTFSPWTQPKATVANAFGALLTLYCCRLFLKNWTPKNTRTISCVAMRSLLETRDCRFPKQQHA